MDFIRTSYNRYISCLQTAPEFLQSRALFVGQVIRNSVFTAVLTFDLGMKAFIVLTPFCNSIVLRAFHRCCTRYMAQLCH